MRFWLDAQLSPALGPWIAAEFGVAAVALRDIGMRDAGDVVVSKDADFPEILQRRGPPPQVLWITCGNTSNSFLKQHLRARMPEALRLLRCGEPLVEIA